MSELGPALEFLYTRLILRDLCGKVLPGALLLVAGGTILTSTAQALDVIKGANLGAWVVFGALAWLTGLAVQGVGELISPYAPVLRYFPRRVTESDYREKMAAFDSEDVANSEDKQRLERLVVINEASGISCLALFFSLVLFAIVRWDAFRQHYLCLIPVALAIVGLAKLHHANAERAYQHMEKVCERHKKKDC